MAYKKTKTEHAYQLFHKDLKNGDIPPVIFMYGVEGYPDRLGRRRFG